MTDDTIELGSFVIVNLVENCGAYHVESSHWDELTAFYANWIERRIDRVIELVATDGAPIVLAASRISEMNLSTPESRARYRAIEAARKMEAGFVEE
jgi:hypothetical protein